MPEAHVNGIRLYYEEQGEGAPILGIHGGGSTALMWGDAVKELARLGRVIVYDRRGCTRSERAERYERTTVSYGSAAATSSTPLGAKCSPINHHGAFGARFSLHADENAAPAADFAARRHSAASAEPSRRLGHRLRAVDRRQAGW